MRQIEFRGKRVDTGEWVEGCLIMNNYEIYPDTKPIKKVDTIYRIKPIDEAFAPQVIPETVGQYVGKKDKNGRKVFESDKVISYSNLYGMPNIECIVVFEAEMFIMKSIEKPWTFTYFHNNECEIIGNIHDNPRMEG